MRPPDLENLLRELTPHVLGALVRHHGDLDACEDAVQEALLAASVQWPVEGVPDNPKGWLITTASRRRIEGWRSDAARRRREEIAAARQTVDPGPVSTVDDTLTVLLLCCHPSLTLAAQVTLTLRAVGGLTTAEIARALLVPEATVGQRISRAKQRIKAAGGTFPPAADRLEAALHVLYLIFNEGYTASSGPDLQRVELTAEAIRLTRQLRRLRPDDGEVAGLLALMLLTDARRPARTRSDGALVPLVEQDRGQWDAEAIAEGGRILSETLGRHPAGPYQLQAAIAAVHNEAARYDDTDWRQILGLYDVLHAVAPGPMVSLSRIVAVAMVHGPRAGLQQLDRAETDPALASHHRTHAVRAHLLDLAGDRVTARDHYELAARRTLSGPERGYLEARAGR
ncbi:RNA polymerase sigma factor [Dactylosporangium sp. NBC_01737]|uniref:RNA polymerase sigma factor n=1 Tax=Dactylosporangium sp. NBC_01737 TaxID=2975959 RepID=UPI002E1062A2|nr:RNA polymerase sigma factor [Dactylosporangium sp. NBC_01737]